MIVENFHRYPPVRRIHYSCPRVTNLDSYIKQGNGSKQVSLHVGLAPSYGELTAESVKQLDEKLKVAISATLRALAEVPLAQRTWEKILVTMLQNSVLEADNDIHYRSDKHLLPSKVRLFQFDRTHNAAVVEAVCALLSISRCFIANLSTGQSVVSDPSQQRGYQKSHQDRYPEDGGNRRRDGCYHRNIQEFASSDGMAFPSRD